MRSMSLKSPATAESTSSTASGGDEDETSAAVFSSIAGGGMQRALLLCPVGPIRVLLCAGSSVIALEGGSGELLFLAGGVRTRGTLDGYLEKIGEKMCLMMRRQVGAVAVPASLQSAHGARRAQVAYALGQLQARAESVASVAALVGDGVSVQALALAATIFCGAAIDAAKEDAAALRSVASNNVERVRQLGDALRGELATVSRGSSSRARAPLLRIRQGTGVDEADFGFGQSALVRGAPGDAD